ncbi:MAG: AI-2E family transporter [Hespellia sp.]|nr:AI-2E family transporter [Hespellia sp.]
MEVTQMTIKKLRGLIVFTLLIMVGLWKFDIVLGVLGFMWGIFFPFILGGAIAFILNVIMSSLEKRLFGEDREKYGKRKKKFARPVSLLLTILIVLGIIALVIFVVMPQLVRTFSSLGESIAVFIPRLQLWIQDFTHNNKDIMKLVNQMQFSTEKVTQWMFSFVGTGAGNVMNTTFAAAKSLVSGITTFFIACSFACYVLIQKEKLHVQIRKVIFAFVPKGKAEAILEICSLTYKTFSNFLTGQCLEALILGSMFMVTMTVIKMPYALLVGVLIAFTALIPIFGAFIGCAVGTFLIFIISPQQAVMFVIMFLVLQQIEGNFIYPHVVGNSVGLPSIWVLAAVSVGGNLMGIVGMLIFIPIVSVVYALFREVVLLNLRKRKIKKVTAMEVEEYSDEEVEQMEIQFLKEHQS